MRTFLVVLLGIAIHLISYKDGYSDGTDKAIIDIAKMIEYQTIANKDSLYKYKRMSFDEKLAYVNSLPDSLFASK